MFTKSVCDRFWKFVIIRDNGCWGWSGSKSRGYGQISTRRGRSPAKAHRVSWFIHNGEPIPNGMSICHTCDNPECTNPEHLFLGTHRDNMMDAHKKGRLNMFNHGLGEKNNMAQFTDNEVRKIRKEYSEGSTLEILAKKYKTSNIVRIVRNKVYYDPDYTPINANMRPRKYRRKLSKKQCKEILASKLPSRNLGRIYGVSKTIILEVKKGVYNER